ncbi:MAG: exodeoxyribonuclease VII large subunit [Culicoidibacterales bacterium]
MEQRYLTVTALNKYIKLKFDRDTHLQVVYLKAEISNFKHHSRGHFYFTLKDEQSRIQAVMFKQQAQKLKFQPQDGMNVFIRGNVNVFESQGNYQLYVEEIVDAGAGNLALAFEQLKQKLDAKGYFASNYKQALPKYPKVIGVVTSPTGAAIRDILTTLQRRAPYAQVLIFPALVQGEQAKFSIVQAIERANQTPGLDVLIVGRGGGSIEDLWAFNEEIVAEAIFKSQLPIISAVGHEVDTTIADFVADVRAATPTAAAELVAPAAVELQVQVAQLQQRLLRDLMSQYQYQKLRYEHVVSSRLWQNPQQLIQNYEQRLDSTYTRLLQQRPHQQILLANQRVAQLEQRLLQAFTYQYQQKEQQFELQRQKLQAYSPLQVMERGYTIVRNPDQHVVRSVQQLAPEQHIQIQFKDGRAYCRIEMLSEEEV